MKQVTFLNKICDVHKMQYANGRIALKLTIAAGQEGEREPMAVATVNLPDEHIGENHVFIKDYAENEGMYDALLKAGIIAQATSTVKSGHLLIPCCLYTGDES